MFQRIAVSSLSVLFGLVLSVAPVLAAVGTQNPNLTVELTINPAVVTPPAQVVVNLSVTNNTHRVNKVVAEVEVTSPSGQVVSYYQNLKLAGGETRSLAISYEVPVGSETGVYPVTLLATDKNGTSSATEYLTVN